jgi:hypothetical protein
MYVVVEALSTKPSAVGNFVKSVKHGDQPIVGNLVSEAWEDALIEDPGFELLQHFENRRELWPDRNFAGSTLEDDLGKSESLTCALYRFYTKGFGEGPTEYFQEASGRHPEVRFVVCWVYFDEGLSIVGLCEIQNGEILDEEVVGAEESPEEYRRLASQWLDWNFPEDDEK